ncbi:Splicing factor [Arthrobotrys megalospora]
MDISALLSPTTTPTPGTASPTNSSPVPGPSTSTGSGTSSHQNLSQNQNYHPSITRRESQPSLPPTSSYHHAYHHPHHNSHSQHQQHQQQHQQQQHHHQHHQQPYHHHIPAPQSHSPPVPVPAPLYTHSHTPHQELPPQHQHQHQYQPQQQQQQQQPQLHQSSQIPHHRPSLNDVRSHSSSALLHSRKPPSQQPYYTSHPDVRRESLPIVTEKVVSPPAPARHHSLNFIDNPTFAPSPLATTQISTPTPPAAVAPPLPPQPTQGRIPSFSSDRGPISRTGSTASMVTIDEERARTDQGSSSRRVSRTKSSASVEMAAPEPTPSPKDASPELFFDDEDEDMEMDEEDESTQPLGEVEVERLADLIEKLDRAHLRDEADAADAPPGYNDSVECIGLLRRGFVASKFSQDYDFKERLNEERVRMLSIYPLTEEMWVEWLHDEAVHADDLLGKVGVMESWAKSVAHEAGSVTLWKGYAKFILRTWREAQQRADAEGGDDEGWAETFNFGIVEGVLWKAVGDTMYNIPRSHEIWNKYCELQLLQLKVMPPGSQSKIEKIQRLYLDRLQVPHDDIDSTFSAYSSFVTTYLPHSEYETTMKAGNKVYQKAKRALENRQRFEYRLRNSYGQDEEGQVWSEYLEWETSQNNADLAKALYERCVLRYPTDSAAWEEYICFMLEKKGSDPAVLPLLELATAHCQWSGTLWSHRILAFDVRRQPLESIERIKHQATTSRLMVDKEEDFKVNLAWCGVLKRRGVAKDAVDTDSFDIAQFGLRSALSEFGPKGVDKDYRIARLLIAFLTETGDLPEAEKVWEDLERDKKTGHSGEYEFWLRYYGWAFRNLGNTGAVAVLKRAVTYWETLDWPEKIIDIYHNQIEEHGEGIDIEGAVMEIRRLRKQVARRRQQEAQEAEQVAQAQAAAVPVGFDAKGKRRRSTNVEEDDELPHKKARASEDIDVGPIPPVSEEAEPAEPAQNGGASAEKEKKNTRDREKLTVFAKNLPPDVDELTVRKFFKDCGTINAFTMIEADDNSATASIEFQNAADVLAAQTRDKKKLNGREITVQIGFNTTVYITNFPPTADEQWIRELFKECGPILEVRFPSLKYNQHRRFCYVQFDASEDAEKATEMNGKEVDGFTLVSKLSDPNVKQERTGAVHEGREVFIRNIDYVATEDEIRELFSKYGTIKSIRLINKGKGNHSGYGFLDFETAESAKASLELHEQKFKSRKLWVVISDPQGSAPASKKSSGKTQAKFPNGAAGSPEVAGSPMSTTASELPDAPDGDTIRQKTLYILNVADTVNDSKIRAIFEKFGALHKVQLQLNHQAAIVEFVEVKDAGRAALAMDGHEIDGRAISFGTRQDMLKTGDEKKPKPGLNPFAKKKDEKKPTTAVTSLAPARVHRPGVAVRGGKTRMGLGFRPSARGGEREEKKEEGDVKPKTNAEFRQMLLKGKADAEDRE